MQSYLPTQNAIDRAHTGPLPFCKSNPIRCPSPRKARSRTSKPILTLKTAPDRHPPTRGGLRPGFFEAHVRPLLASKCYACYTGGEGTHERAIVDVREFKERVEVQ